MARWTQADADRQLAECVRMSRENAVKYAAQAEQEAAQGNHERAAQLREHARMSREEADEHEAAGARTVSRRPGVNTAADKARWEREHRSGRENL